VCVCVCVCVCMRVCMQVMEARRTHVESMERKMREMQGGVDADQALAMGAHTVGQCLLCWCLSRPCMLHAPTFPPPPRPPRPRLMCLRWGWGMGWAGARARAEACHGYAQQVSQRRRGAGGVLWLPSSADRQGMDEDEDTRTLELSGHLDKAQVGPVKLDVRAE